ncbi:hypothetical protein CIW49_13580 [Mycolicibacterium sp. P1-18]|nr:hypothetical protein CIW49_13580 [Mycolicibacterium sp. P1-18]
MDQRFNGEVAAIVHAQLADPECSATSRESIAAFARKVADIAMRTNSTFSYEWFYGACGLDPWGDLNPVLGATRTCTVKWDPELSDFRTS